MIDPSPRLTYLGHATTLIEMNGVRLLTDPVLRRRVAHLRHRYNGLTASIPLEKPIDAVIISHLHFDHLDLPSLRLVVGRSTRLLVPRGAARLLREFKHVEEMAVGDSRTVGPLTLTATYADHDPARHRFGPKATCLGFIISQGRFTIYFAGDTALFPEMADFNHSLDVALLPVWGWGPTLGLGHMDPHQAAQALPLLRPRLAVPIHWGTLHPLGMGWLNPRFLHEPPHQFVRHAAGLAPDVLTRIVAPGETLLLVETLTG
jgi:L-ascorbate metabolism protein UlaG (beta-lactamase superfamily)